MIRSVLHQLVSCSLLTVSLLIKQSGALPPYPDQLQNPTARSDANNLPHIITGIYGSKPSIVIHDSSGKANWTWTISDVQPSIPKSIERCIKSGSSATEVKRAAGGEKIVAIIGGSALVINYAPNNPKLDKTVAFGVCLDAALGHAHTVELLPDNNFAVATSGQTKYDGLWVFDSSKLVDNPSSKQRVYGVRAIHGMLWDHDRKTLWVTGNTDAADGSGGTAYGTVQGYTYKNSIRMPPLTKSKQYTIPFAKQLDTEWDGTGTGFEKWWNGPHDLVPIPGQSKLLFSMDRDIHAIDLSIGQFDHDGPGLQQKYLKGFQPIGNRQGNNGERLPRSDIKSISVSNEGAALYTQAEWQNPPSIPKQVNLLSPSGDYSVLLQGKNVYRSRWFADIQGWPTA